MSLTDLVNKGKCLVGLHEGEWRAASPRDCTFVRICDRCHVETRRVDHLWPEWSYAADGACDQKRVCSRCGSAESRLLHTWGASTYVADAACERHRVCSRCAAASPVDPLHTFDRWTYGAGDSCEQVQTCGRCGSAGAGRRVAHTWSAWQHSDAHHGPVRACTRCGERQAQAVPPLPGAGETKTGSRAADPGGSSRKEMFDALKGKMQQLAEQTAAMDRVLGSLVDNAEKKLAELTADGRQAPASSERDSRQPPAPPVMTDAAVEDLLARAGAAAAAAPRDPRLAGHWQYVDIIPGGYGVPGMTTQYDLVLLDNGRFEERSVSSGPAGMVRGDPSEGEWRDEAGSLVLVYASGEQRVRRYTFHHGALYFPGSRWTRPWERVR